MQEYQVKKGTITDRMIIDFEANNRGNCLFCGAYSTRLLEGYFPNDIPEGFYCAAFQCLECSRSWRETAKYEEIESSN